MALSFPTASTSPTFVRSGGVRLYLAAYVAAGADATGLRDMGGTMGALSVKTSKTNTQIECEQFLNSIGAIPAKEEFLVTVTMLDTTLANITWAMGAAASRLTLGDRTDNAGALLGGEELAMRYYQLIIKGLPPSQSSASASVFQAYMASVETQPEFKFEKGKPMGIQITFRLHTDTTITTAKKVYNWFEA